MPACVFALHTHTHTHTHTHPQVRVSCVSGCSCAGEHADAAIHVRHSIRRILTLQNVTQSAACHVRFEVLPLTSSGGHKFKISALTVRTEVLLARQTN